MITFEEVWHFIETTHVEDPTTHPQGGTIQLVEPDNSEKVSNDSFIIKTLWENRYDLNILQNLWEKNYTFIVHGSQITPNVKNLVEEIEQNNNVEAQSHVYMGKYGSRSFGIHCDKPDNLIVQCIGKSRATIYNEYGDHAKSLPGNLTIKEQHILEPGNSIYVPSLQFHLFEPLTDRLSISVPMYKR